MARTLHIKTAAYARSKMCNGLAGEVALADMPQLKAVFEESDTKLGRMERFVAGVQARLNECLRGDSIPDPDLVEEIAVCKIKAIEVAIERVHALRQEVGSYALMHGTGFELADMLLTCKFAEGDSRILQQKIARDRLKKLRTEGPLAAAISVFSADRDEYLAAMDLARKLAPAGRNAKLLAKAMEESWREIYKLADLVAARRVRDGAPGTFVEGKFTERILPASMSFDENWMKRITEHEALDATERRVERQYEISNAGDRADHAAARMGHAPFPADSHVYTEAIGRRAPHSDGPFHSHVGKGPVVVPSRE